MIAYIKKMDSHQAQSPNCVYDILIYIFKCSTTKVKPSLSINIKLYNQPISLVSRVFANGMEDLGSIPKT